MNLTENINEGIKSILTNKLRTFLTVSIIVIGITSLIGILTVIESLKASINENFSNLGSNTFYISNIRGSNRKQRGVLEKKFPPITYDEVRQFTSNYASEGITSINTFVTFIAEVKYKSKITNPNISVRGGDINYLTVEGYNLDDGRNFSSFEQQHGTNVVLIGHEILDALFFKHENPINKTITFLGNKFKIIGILEDQGSSGGGSSANRTIIVPLETARKISQNRSLRYSIEIALTNPTQMEMAIGEATGLMKTIRKDLPGSINSFEIKERKSVAEKLEEITAYLRIGGFTIGFITLIGASIGLMNIMLVSVTERTKEIGVRKALGATPFKIRQQFLIEAIVITLIGGAGGIVLGILIGNTISNLIGSEIYVIPWLWILLGFIVSIIVGLLSGYLPAYKASKLDPIDSLRFE